MQVNSLASRWSLFEDERKVTFLQTYTPPAKVHSLGREAWLDFGPHSLPWPDSLRRNKLYKVVPRTGHCGSEDHHLLEPDNEVEVR